MASILALNPRRRGFFTRSLEVKKNQDYFDHFDLVMRNYIISSFRDFQWYKDDVKIHCPEEIMPWWSLNQLRHPFIGYQKFLK